MDATSPPPPFKPSTWLGKFACAFRGLWVAIKGQSSFAVHLPVMAGVIGVAWYQDVSRTDWLLLTICITIVIAAELVNTAIELLARAITEDFNPHIRDALDIASSVVLATVLGAVTVGVVVLFG